ncbi:MAG: hypothetical protein FWE02_04995, partial [Defluviitaleaceae bacterium]|nr:hypothetical protein [Defluviitaleaceae bacterium]
MKNYKKVAALFLALVMTFGILFVYNTQGNSPNDFYIPVSIVPGSEIIPVRSFFIDDSLLNGETLYSVDNIEDWQYLKIELSALSRGFYAFQPIDVTLLNYHVQRARDLSLYYIGNPILPENLQLDSRISPNPIETPFGTIEWLNPFRMRTIGPTMHQAIFEFEGGPAYYENISNDLPIIGLRPENYGTINYHVIRAV